MQRCRRPSRDGAFGLWLAAERVAAGTRLGPPVRRRAGQRQLEHLGPGIQSNIVRAVADGIELANPVDRAVLAAGSCISWSASAEGHAYLATWNSNRAMRVNFV